jgi:hypothetical protein
MGTDPGISPRVVGSQPFQPIGGVAASSGHGGAEVTRGSRIANIDGATKFFCVFRKRKR